MNSEVSFNEVKSKLERLFNELDTSYELRKKDYSFLIKGRSAEVTVNGISLGWIGEIHPEVLEKLEIDTPLAGFEINLSKLVNLLK